MKTIKFVDHNDETKTITCNDFAIIAIHHDSCAIAFLGEFVRKDDHGVDQFKTLGQEYGIKSWWLVEQPGGEND